MKLQGYDMVEETEKIVTVPEEDSGTEVQKSDGALEGKPERGSPSSKAAAAEAADVLRKQFEDSQAEVMRLRTERAESERRAREAEARAGQSEATAKNSVLGQIAAAIDARNGALNIEKAAFKAAMEAGDFDKVADAQLKLSRISAELLQLEGAKAQAEEQARAPSQQPIITRPGDEVEAFIQERRLSPKSASWLRDHPQALARQARLARAHDEAVEEHGFETPGYFETIEKIMGFEKKANGSSDGQDGGEVKSVRTVAEPRRAPAAPPSSGAGTQGAKGIREVRMTEEMRNAARISGISEEEYAKNWLLAKQQGLIQ